MFNITDVTNILSDDGIDGESSRTYDIILTDDNGGEVEFTPVNFDEAVTIQSGLEKTLNEAEIAFELTTRENRY